MAAAERHGVLPAPRYTRWRVFTGKLFLASVPSDAAGLTEREALAWAEDMFPNRTDLRVVGVR